MTAVELTETKLIRDKKKHIRLRWFWMVIVRWHRWSVILLGKPVGVGWKKKQRPRAADLSARGGHTNANCIYHRNILFVPAGLRVSRGLHKTSVTYSWLSQTPCSGDGGGDPHVRHRLTALLLSTLLWTPRNRQALAIRRINNNNNNNWSYL